MGARRCLSMLAIRGPTLCMNCGANVRTSALLEANAFPPQNTMLFEVDVVTVGIIGAIVGATTLEAFDSASRDEQRDLLNICGFARAAGTRLGQELAQSFQFGNGFLHTGAAPNYADGAPHRPADRRAN